MEDLNAQAIIPRNPRGERTAPYSLKGNSVFCPAELPMHRRGKMTVKKAGITYLQYSCPIHFGKERQRHLLCPVAHPKFTTQKGCNALIRLTQASVNALTTEARHSRSFKKKRTSVERVFSRLLSISMQDLPVSGMEAVKKLLHDCSHHCASHSPSSKPCRLLRQDSFCKIVCTKFIDINFQNDFVKPYKVGNKQKDRRQPSRWPLRRPV